MNFNNLPINAQMHALRHSIQQYDEWVEVLYGDLDEIISNLLDESELFSKLSETEITAMIKTNLRMRYYLAQVDSYKNGNADLSVESNSFKWIGEAKIVNNDSNTDINYLYQGLLQLMTRYSKGESNANAGGMLIYIKPNSRFMNEAKLMETWLKFISTNAGDYKTHNSCTKKKSCQISEHIHSISGYTYLVRHMPMTFHHLPEDSSGLVSKKYDDQRKNYQNMSISSIVEN